MYGFEEDGSHTDFQKIVSLVNKTVNQSEAADVNITGAKKLFLVVN